MGKRAADVDPYDLKQGRGGGDEEAPTGEMQQASAEVMATRKIFKLKRNPGATTAAALQPAAGKPAPMPSFNLLAGAAKTSSGTPTAAATTSDNKDKDSEPVAKKTKTDGDAAITPTTPATTTTTTTTTTTAATTAATTTDSTAPAKPAMPAFSFSALAASSKSGADSKSGGFSFTFSSASSTAAPSAAAAADAKATGGFHTGLFSSGPPSSVFTFGNGDKDNKDKAGKDSAGDNDAEEVFAPEDGVAKAADPTPTPESSGVAAGEEDDCNLLEVKAKVYRLEPVQTQKAPDASTATLGSGVAGGVKSSAQDEDKRKEGSAGPSAQESGSTGEGGSDKQGAPAADSDAKKEEEGEGKKEEEDKKKADASTAATPASSSSVQKDWVQKGMGQLRLNINNKTKVARVIIRHIGTHRLILNASLIAGKEPELAGEKSVRVMLFNITTKEPDVFVIRVPSKEEATQLFENMKSSMPKAPGVKGDSE